MNSSPREQELLARHLLANPDEISALLIARDWGRLLVVAHYAAQDANQALTRTDPALYRTLRNQITEFRIRWRLDIDKLERLNQETAQPTL